MAEKKPCRVCSDFKQWTKSEKEKDTPPTPSAAATPKEPENIIAKGPEIECPPDSLQLGRSTWTFLHTMASYYPDKPDITAKEAASQLINSLSVLYPCSYCAKHLKKELEHNPPLVESRSNLEKYLCDLHNEVNERLGKPLFDCSRIRERWFENPKCD